MKLQKTILCGIQNIKRAIKHYEQELKNSEDISLNEGLCLCALNKGIKEPKKIADMLEISPSRLSRILEEMEDKEFITREFGKVDRRSISVILTEKGKKKIESVQKTNIKLHIDEEICSFIQTYMSRQS